MLLVLLPLRLPLGDAWLWVDCRKKKMKTLSSCIWRNWNRSRCRSRIFCHLLCLPAQLWFFLLRVSLSFCSCCIPCAPWGWHAMLQLAKWQKGVDILEPKGATWGRIAAVGRGGVASKYAHIHWRHIWRRRRKSHGFLASMRSQNSSCTRRHATRRRRKKGKKKELELE